MGFLMLYRSLSGNEFLQNGRTRKLKKRKCEVDKYRQYPFRGFKALYNVTSSYLSGRGRRAAAGGRRWVPDGGRWVPDGGPKAPFGAMPYV